MQTDWYCCLCNKYSGGDHDTSTRHMGRLAKPDWYIDEKGLEEIHIREERDMQEYNMRKLRFNMTVYGQMPPPPPPFPPSEERQPPPPPPTPASTGSSNSGPVPVQNFGMMALPWLPEGTQVADWAAKMGAQQPHIMGAGVPSESSAAAAERPADAATTVPSNRLQQLLSPPRRAADAAACLQPAAAEPTQTSTAAPAQAGTAARGFQ